MKMLGYTTHTHNLLEQWVPEEEEEKNRLGSIFIIFIIVLDAITYVHASKT
jgi:hypothetical protein